MGHPAQATHMLAAEILGMVCGNEGHAGARLERLYPMNDIRDTRIGMRDVTHTTPPEPVAGQVWVAPGEKPRLVCTVRPKFVTYRIGDRFRDPWRSQWDKWVARTGARPQ